MIKLVLVSHLLVLKVRAVAELVHDRYHHCCIDYHVHSWTVVLFKACGSSSGDL